MESDKSKLQYISLLNVIAIYLVILGHSGCVYAGKWNYNVVYNNSTIIRHITHYIYSFHMPLFVFISGYLYCAGKQRKKYQSLKELTYKKVLRLIMPYLFTGIFFVLPIQIIFNLDDNNSSYVKRILNDIILAKQPGHMWFVLMLFNLFIIFYIIERYLNSNKVVVNLLLLLIISIISIKIPNIYQINQSLQYMVFFYIGYIFYKYKFITNLIKDKWLVFFIAHTLFFNFDYFIFSNFNVKGNYAIYIKLFNLMIDKITAFLGIIFIFTMVQFLFDKNKCTIDRLINSNLFEKMYRNSYLIYLIHQPIMLLILEKIKNLPIKPISVYSILFWSTLFISFVLSEGYYFWISLLRQKMCLKSIFQQENKNWR